MPLSALEISELRNKARAGVLTPEDMKQAIAVLREDRVTASSTTKKSASRASGTKLQVSGDDLLNELLG